MPHTWHILKINDVSIEKVDPVKFLGILID